MSPHRCLPPVPHRTALVQPALIDAIGFGTVLVDARDGCFVPEALAAAVHETGRADRCAWLRVIPGVTGDLDRLVAEAFGRVWSPGRTGRRTRRRSELSAACCGAPAGAVGVIELQGGLDGRSRRTLCRLIDRARRSSFCVVVVLHDATPERRLIGRVDRYLRSTDLEYRAESHEGEWERRLLGLCGGRAAIAHNVLQAAAVWPAEVIEPGILAARSSAEVVSNVTAALVTAMPSEAWCELAAAARSGYAVAGGDVIPGGEALRPWLIPLEHHCATVSPVWRSAVLELQPPTRDGVRARVEWRRDEARWRAPASPGRPGQPSFVRCQLLGGFEVSVDGCRIDAWHGRLGRSVLRYLLVSPTRSASRDELLEAFWPGVDPCTSRNRLQVAISGLRRSFQTVPHWQSPVVAYAHGRYAVDPRLEMTTDVDRFELLAKEGLAAERVGDPTGARIDYLEAIGLYRGDFAPDLIYDEWTILTRERLRLVYLDTLDRLARINLAADRVDDCVDVARRMLDQDPCREDAHRLLMRCYARQGKLHLVDYQYDFCVRVMRCLLDVTPSAETTATHREQRLATRQHRPSST